MKSANPEQELAINCHGGVLSAGAGSGKTFVIIEHTLQKVIKIAIEEYSKSSISWKESFIVRVSRMALLTFTRKASAEMQDRLISRTKNIELPSFLHSAVLEEAISCMFVGTIHSFLLKVIKDGLVSGVNNIEITSQKIFEKNLSTAVEKSLIKIKDEIDEKTYSRLLSNLDQIKSSFYKIFNDAELRIFWEDFYFDKVEMSFWKRFYELNDISSIFTTEIDLSEYDKDSSKSWYRAVQSFSKIKVVEENTNFQDHYDDLDEFFNSFKRIIPPRKSEYHQVIILLNKIKKLRSSFNKIRGDLSSFIDNPGAMEHFYFSLKKIFDLLNETINYQNDITFSTLEYIIFRSDFEKPILDYLLVDEFQDTSWVQHKIISKLVQGEWNNIFFVGDQKQAIYRFRGGEVGVFQRAIKDSSNLLKLRSNYRSHSNIVKFNNDFFSKIFNTSDGFVQSDKSQKIFEGQVAKKNDDFIDPGRVRGIRYVIKNLNGRIGSSEIEKIEAEIIYYKINKLLKKGSHEVAILYPRLSPSYYLIKKLLNNDFGFSSQIKVPMFEHPIICLLKIILENALDFYPSEEISQRNINEVLRLIKSKTNYKISKDRINNNLDYFGPVFALMKELDELDITMSDRKYGIDFIKEICDKSDCELEKVWKTLIEHIKDLNSIEFKNSGEKEINIKIMSVHSSKGLEFENVILGGIHSNGRRIDDKSLIKKWPGSFKWMPEKSSGKLVKSLNFILEDLEDKKLEFDEQIRLLYVANTRAKKSLYFPFILDSNKNSTLGQNKNSWINAFDTFSNHIEFENIDIPLHSNSFDKRVRKLPLFHIDDMGINNKFAEASFFNITADQSVTGLSELYVCPRKYYFTNICKYDESLVDFINEIYDNDLPSSYKKFLSPKSSNGVKSTKERGLFVHQYIENYIKNGKNRQDIEVSESSAINFCLNNIDKISSSFEIFSEYPIKFKLNGQYVNGVCDLILVSNNRDSAEIWDFKTGSLDLVNSIKYSNQLKLYGIGVFDLFPKMSDIILKIFSLDEQKVTSIPFTRVDAQKLSLEIADLASRPWVKVEGNCQSCEFNKICQVKLINC